MPESPEVQQLASFLADRAVGREIRSVDVVVPKALKTTDPGVGALIGRRVTSVARRGKMVDIAATDAEGDELHLVVHFGHDGWVLWNPVVPAGLKKAGEASLMARVRLGEVEPTAEPEAGPGFDLTDAGPWRALTIHLVTRPEDVPAVARLGLDPLDDAFDTGRFAAILANRRKQIKALLQDQSAFAGIGNAYSDEILHAAKISPLTHAANLSPAEIMRLAVATRRTLLEATEARAGVAAADLRAAKHAALHVHRRAGEACPVCGDEIREFTFSGAAAQYCPTCQTRGAVLA